MAKHGRVTSRKTKVSRSGMTSRKPRKGFVPLWTKRNKGRGK